MPAKAKSKTAILFRQFTNRVTVNPVIAKSKIVAGTKNLNGN